MLWLALLLAYHAAGVVVALRPGVSNSRRLLASAMALTVPVAGPALGLVVRRTIGRGRVLAHASREAERHALRPEDVLRLGEAPPLLDRLMSWDPAARLSAMVELSAAADAHAIALLRWAIEHGSPEVVLEAALTLEEIDLRREARLQDSHAALGDTPTFQAALAAAEAAASRLHAGLVDPVNLTAVADQARSAYELALSLEPTRWPDISVQMVKLELAAGRPEAALQQLALIGERLEHEPDLVPTDVLEDLLDQAAFAARRFDLLSRPLAS